MIDYSGFASVGGFPKVAVRSHEPWLTKDKGRQESRKCDQCARSFIAAKRKPTTFCSRRCRGDWRIANNPRRRACIVCKAPIVGKMHKTQRTCGDKACTAENVRRKTRSPKTCRQCSVVFWPVQQTPGVFTRFCSARCYNAHRRGARVTVKCVCGVTFVRRVSSGAKPKGDLRFCSKECSHAYFKAERHPCYRGVTDPNRGRAWAHRAESIRVRDGRCCRRCGKPESENGGRRLHVDHLIPWRAFANKSDANDPSNLAALCMSCHAVKTQTVEKQYLRGDVLGLKQFIASLHLPSAQLTQTVTADGDALRNGTHTLKRDERRVGVGEVWGASPHKVRHQIGRVHATD